MLLSRSELERLTRTYNRWHISLYMPTERVGQAVQKNPIRFGNLLDKAEERLKEAGVESDQIRNLLGDARDLLENEIFWQNQGQGLALFLAEDLASYYQLPMTFEEQVVVSDHFHIKPLLPALSNNGRYYVLTLDQQEIQLFQGTKFNLGEVNLENIPENLAEILEWDDPERRLQLHTGSEAVMDGGVAAIFHGHGYASEDDPKEYIKRYFQRIDQGVSEWLGGEEAPLVLVGVEYLLPLYREANSYPHLLQEGVKKDPQALSREEIQQEAWETVQPLFAREEQEMKDAFYHLSGQDSDRTSTAVEAIVPAAHFERVEALFVSLDQECWGSFDPEANQVTFHDGPRPTSMDLVNYAAAQTLINSGSVYPVDEEEVPGGGPLAAILRF